MHKYTQSIGQKSQDASPIVYESSEELLRLETLKRVAERRAILDAKAIANVERQRARRIEYKNGKKPKTAAELYPSPSAPMSPVDIHRGKIQWIIDRGEIVEKTSKRAKKTAKSSGELNLDTLDVTPPPFEPLKRLEKLRLKCQETGFLLKKLEAVPNVLNAAGNKILNCSLWGLFQVVSTEVNYKVGTALCKNRLCPNCQRVLSAKRKYNHLYWWEANAEQLRRYFFYHLVLTVRRSAAEGVRTNLYTADLLRYFAELRGSSKTLTGAQQRQRSKMWKSFVAGGSYSVEVKAGRDGSPNIHIHCLLIGVKQLHNEAKDSEFLKFAKPLWKEITGDSDNVFISKVYYKDDQGKEHYCCKGTEVHIDQAVAECMKYTIKAEAASLQGFTTTFLTDLLTFRNRYYGRFGCLSSNDKSSKQFKSMDMLCTDYKDLEELTRKELERLFNPETGEVVKADDTQFVATPLRNMKPKQAKPVAVAAEILPPGVGRVLILGKGDEVIGSSAPDSSTSAQTYYEALPLPNHLAVAQYKFFPYHEKDRAAIYLSRSISDYYDSKLELDSVQNPPAPKVASKVRTYRGQNNFIYPDKKSKK